MASESPEERLKALEKRVRVLEDIEEIKILQRTYGFYLDYGLWDEIIDLFSDNTKSLEVADSGVYLGKAGVGRFFRGIMGRYKPVPKDSMTVTMSLMGVIHVDPDGKTAKGRWNNLMFLSSADNGSEPLLGQGIYEIEYVKENGKWMFLRLNFYLNMRTPFKDGWVKTPVATSMKRENIVKPDLPTTVYEPYPTDYITPFHYPHPITGKYPGTRKK